MEGAGFIRRALGLLDLSEQCSIHRDGLPAPTALGHFIESRRIVSYMKYSLYDVIFLDEISECYWGREAILKDRALLARIRRSQHRPETS